MSFTTVISPSTAIDRILASGYSPFQFIGRAHRDHGYEWATEFEILAYMNDCLGFAMTAQEAYNVMSENIDMNLAIKMAAATPWIAELNAQWFAELQDIVYFGDAGDTSFDAPFNDVEDFFASIREYYVPATPSDRFGFNSCSNASELKSLYRTLSKQYHPDLGGSTALMQELNAAYDSAVACL
jgi:hypothetical protein